MAAWWPLAGLALLAAALPATTASLPALSAAGTPRALAAGVPVAAAVWAWLRLREAAPCSAEGRVLGPLLALLAAIVLAWSLTIEAAAEHRLLLLAPLAAALVLAHGGLALLRRLAGPVALLLLAWPWPHELLARLSAPLLVDWAGTAGATLAGWAGAEISATPGGMWRLVTPQGPLLAGLDLSCSGAGGVMAVLILAAPVLSERRVPPGRATAWLGLGLLLAAAGNVLRIALLFWLAATRGCDSVFAAIHAHAGSALVLLTWLGMLAALPWLGPPRPPSPVPAGPRRGLWLATCLPGLLLCALFDLHPRPAPPLPPSAVVAEAVPEPLVEAGPPAPAPTAPVPAPAPAPAPPVPAAPPPPAALRPLDLLPAVPGWQRWAHGAFPWATGMYGAEARAERLVYQHGREGRLVWIDVLLCPQLADIERHTVAGCFTSHAYRVELSDNEAIAGTAVQSWVVEDGKRRRWAVASWTQAAVPLGAATPARRTIIWRRIDAGDGEAELAELRTLATGLLRGR